MNHDHGQPNFSSFLVSIKIKIKIFTLWTGTPYFIFLMFILSFSNSLVEEDVCPDAIGIIWEGDLKCFYSHKNDYLYCLLWLFCLHMKETRGPQSCLMIGVGYISLVKQWNEKWNNLV